MPKQVRRRQPMPARVTRKRVAATREEQAAQGQLERGVKEIEKVIADIQRGLASAERRIETDARQRIRALQKEGRAQMRALEAKRREATRLFGRLSAAAGGSLEDITRTVQTMVTDARTDAGAVINRSATCSVDSSLVREHRVTGTQYIVVSPRRAIPASAEPPCFPQLNAAARLPPGSRKRRTTCVALPQCLHNSGRHPLTVDDARGLDLDP